MSTATAVSSALCTIRCPAPWLSTVTMMSMDALAILISAGSAVIVRFAFGGHYELSFYLRLLPLIGLFWGSYWLSGLYPGFAQNPAAEIQSVFKSTAITYLFFIAATFFMANGGSYSRLVIIGAWILSAVLVCIFRVLARHLFRNTPWWGTSAVLLGSGPSAFRVAESIACNPTLGLHLIGILTNEFEHVKEDGLVPVLGRLEMAPNLASEYGIRYAILAMPKLSSAELAAVIEKYASRFHRIVVVPDLFGLSSLGVSACDLGGVLGVEISHRLLHRVPQFTKRTFDLTVAVITASVLSPLLIALWLAIRLTSRGPALYWQERVGQGGNRFLALKFRSMVVNADTILYRYLERHPELMSEWERDHKLRNDPRVTLMGGFIRKLSLDELPQLWNVLRGDMSLVGPRPIVQTEVAKYANRYELYQKVRPGITGLWQVSGRNNTTYEERVTFDEYYVRNWSLWLDMYILARTAKVVLTGDGAY